MSELTKLAAMGALAGWTLGCPRSGRTEYSKLNGYDPIPVRMVTSHALDAWVAWGRHLSDGRPVQVLASTVDEHLRLTTEESAFGFLNVRRGFGSPLAGAHANPRPTGSEAVLRAVFWGLAFHGNADKAAEHAYYDASLDHAGDGVWVPCALAAAVATANPSCSISDVVEAFVSTLPAESGVHKGLGELLKSAENPEGPREFRRKVMGLVGRPDWADAAYSGLFVLLGLVHSKRDTGRGMLVTAGCGGASPHSTGATGVLVTLLAGSLAEEWVSPLGKEYLAGFGLRGIDPPATIEDWAGMVGSFASEPEMVVIEPVVEAVTVETELAVEGEGLVSDDSANDADLVTDVPVLVEDSPMGAVEEVWPLALPVQPKTRELLAQDPLVTWFEAKDLLVKVRYFDSPMALPKFSTRIQVSLVGQGDEARNHELGLSVPKGWDLATRMTGARVDPGTGPEFPAVVQPTSEEAARDARVVMSIDGVDHLVPLVVPQPWWVAGPFNNAEGMGYERAFRPETDLNLEETMNGRSDMGIKWERSWFPGHTFDLEPSFRSGPGVVYLYGEMEFERPGRVTVMAAVGSGLKLWADGQRLLAYHDYHTPLIRPEGRYLATFPAHGSVKLLVKVLRENQPVGPLTLVFFDEDGNLVHPSRFCS